MMPNIKENPRNCKRPKRGHKRLFNAAIHALRLHVERTFAWEDKFKRLLLRFERTSDSLQKKMDMRSVHDESRLRAAYL